MLHPDFRTHAGDCEGYYGKGKFCREDFSVLAEMLAKIEGKFILSLNDKPEVRELFAGFTFVKPRWLTPAATAKT